MTLNSNHLIGFGGAADLGTPPLDLIAGSATFAVGLRRLRTAYVGNALTAKLTGGTTQAIGFSGNDLDVAALIAFAAGANTGVSTWNDQTGNTRDLTQSTFANEPLVATLGALNTTLSAKGSVKFDGTNDEFASTATGANIYTAAAYTFMAVVNITSSNSSAADPSSDPAILTGAGGYFAQSFRQTTAAYSSGHFDGAVKYATPAYTFATTAILLGKYDGTNIRSCVGGGAATTQAAGNISVLTDTLIVGRGRTTNFLTGHISEMMTFNSHLSSSDCNLIANNMAGYWGAAWSNISF